MTELALPSIAQHAKKYGIVPLKKYGQNFIFDSSLCDKIVRASELAESEVALEIGPGTAGLTRAILKKSPKLLTVVETDTRLLPLLAEISSHYPNLRIIHGNALEFDLAELTRSTGQKVHIIANLPYQIGTKLLINWLKTAHLISGITIMLQKEVVERLLASPHNKEYGRLSVICQLTCLVKKCFDVSPQAFYPAPKVKSAVVRLVPRGNGERLDSQTFHNVELITMAAFGQRRKMIKTSLQQLVSGVDNLLESASIEPSMRSENISPQAYLALAKSLVLRQ